MGLFLGYWLWCHRPQHYNGQSYPEAGITGGIFRLILAGSFRDQH